VSGTVEGFPARRSQRSGRHLYDGTLRAKVILRPCEIESKKPRSRKILHFYFLIDGHEVSSFLAREAWAKAFKIWSTITLRSCTPNSTAMILPSRQRKTEVGHTGCPHFLQPIRLPITIG